MPYDPKKFEAFKSRSQTPSDPASTLMDMWHAANTKDLQNASLYDPLADVARGGQYLQKNVERGSQDMVNMLHQKLGIPSEIAAIPGAALNTVSEFVVPQTRLGVGLAALPYAAKAISGAGRALGVLRGGGSALESNLAKAAPSSEGLAEAGQAASSGPASLPQAPANALERGPSSWSLTDNPSIFKGQISDWQKGLMQEEARRYGTTADHPEIAQWAANRTKQTIGNLAEELRKIGRSGKVDESQIDVLIRRMQHEGDRLDVLKGMGTMPQNIPIDEMGRPLGTAAAASAEAASKIARNKPGAIAQLITARAGKSNGKLTPQMVQDALDNPKILDEAPSLEEAASGYKEAIGGLKGKTQALSERLNKTVIRPGDYDGAIDRAGRILNGTPLKDEPAKLNPQEALTGLQSINQAMRDRAYTQGMHPDQQKEVLKVKEGLLDFLQNNGTPKIREAGRKLYEAHIKDAFSSWLPQNKFGSPDAMRTTWMSGEAASGLGSMLGGAAMGHPIAGAGLGAALYGGTKLANALLTSPRVAGKLIQNLGTLRDPTTWQGIQQSGIGLSNALK